MIINEVRSANIRGVRVYRNQGKYYVRKGDARKEISKDEYDKLMSMLPSEVRPKNKSSTKKSSDARPSEKPIESDDNPNKSDNLTKYVDKSSKSDDKSRTSKSNPMPKNPNGNTKSNPLIKIDPEKVAHGIDSVSDWIKDKVIRNLAHRK